MNTIDPGHPDESGQPGDLDQLAGRHRKSGLRRGGSPDHDTSVAAERRAAARLLMAHPLVTATGPYAESFPLIRRHADWLGQRFGQFLGYRLVVEAGYARLYKAGLGPGAGRRLERPGTGAPFTPRAYAYLALALSVLVTAPEQLLLSQLVADLRAAAVDAGITLEDIGRQSERRTLASALRVLVEWQVLAETEGSVGALGDGDGSAQALLTVNRDIARALVAGPLSLSRNAEELVHRAAEPGPGGGERTVVRRRLAETPTVLLDDLTGPERDWLRQRQRREAEAFADFLGLEAEIRAEGVALLDPADELTDLELPGTGTLAQAALLLTERLVEQLRPLPGGRVDPVEAAAGPVIGVPIPEALIDGALGDIADEYGVKAGWRRDYLADRAAFRRDVLELLHRMRLIDPAGPPRSRTAAAAQAQAQAQTSEPDPEPDLAMSGLTAQDMSVLTPPEGTSRTPAGSRGSGPVNPRGWVLLATAARYAPQVELRPALSNGRHSRAATARREAAIRTPGPGSPAAPAAGPPAAWPPVTGSRAAAAREPGPPAREVSALPLRGSADHDPMPAAARADRTPTDHQEELFR